MHPQYRQANARSRDVIGAAIEVHKEKGPALLLVDGIHRMILQGADGSGAELR
jgi:hypothetical protein